MRDRLLKINRDHISIGLISFLFLMIYLLLSKKLNIWIDEYFTLYTISETSIRDVIYKSISFEGQPAVYFIIAYLIIQIKSSVFALRILSVLSVIAAGLFINELYKYNSVKPSKFMLVIILSNSLLINTATEIRLYSLVLFLGSILLYIFQRNYTKHEIPKQIRVIFVLIAIISVNTQYYLSFILLSNGIYLLLKGMWKNVIIYLIDMSFVILSLLWAPFFLEQHINMHAFDNETFQLKEIFIFFLKRFDSHFFCSQYFPFQTIGYIIQALIILTIIGSLFYHQKFISYIRNNDYLFIQTLTIIISYSLILFILGDEFVSARHTTVLFIPSFILFIPTFDILKKKYIKPFAMLMLIILYSLSAINSNREYIKNFNVLDSVDYISERSSENEPVLINRNLLSLPFKHYFKEKNTLITLPFEINDSTGFNLEDLNSPLNKKEIKVLMHNLSKSNNFWIVNFVEEGYNDSNYYHINEILEEEYHVLSDTLIADPKKQITYKDVQIRYIKRTEDLRNQSSVSK